MSWFLSGYVSGCQTYCYNDKSLNHKILVGRGLWTSSSAIPTTQRRTSFKVCPGIFQINFEYLQGIKILALLRTSPTALIQTLYRFFFLDLQLEFPKRQSCFLSFCVHLWEDCCSIFCNTQARGDRNLIPFLPSLLHAEQIHFAVLPTVWYIPQPWTIFMVLSPVCWYLSGW